MTVSYKDPQKRREQANRWAAANRERLREYMRAWKLAHPESVKANRDRTREQKRQQRSDPEERARVNEMNRAWRKRNPESRYATKRRMLLKSRGLSEPEYDALLLAQDGLCAICRQPERVERLGKLPPLCIDHDHDTGEPRGLLCNVCNRAIGLLRDDPLLVRAALVYLERYRARGDF